MQIHITTSAIYTGIEDVDTGIDIYSPTDSDGDEETYAAMLHIARGDLGDDSIETETEAMIASYWDDGATQLVRIDSSSILARALMAYMHVSTVEELAARLPWSAYLGDDGYIYTSHGLGYDWVDMDLLGGTGDGSARKRFEDTIRGARVIVD